MSSTADRTPEWDRLRSEHLRPKADRSESTARGMHHIALLWHHIAISISPENHAAARRSLAENNIALDFEHDTSMYFRGPDGERVELIADELGEMYGDDVS